MNFKLFEQHGTTIFVYIILAVLILVTSVVDEKFLTSRNIANILRQSVPLGFVAIGQTFPILVAGIDLSVGSVISLTSCLTTGIILGRESLVAPVVALVILLAVAIGFLNGFTITKGGVHPLITTLGMMTVVQGTVLLYTKSPYGSVPLSYGFIAWGQIGFIPFPIFPLAAVAFAGIVLLRRTKFGRYVYATGGNDEVARLSGIKIDKVRIVAYMICSFTAALTGLYLASRMGMGDPLAGDRYMLDSIVPVVVGGTSLTGGKGGVTGTLAGIYILTILSNGMNFLEVSSYWQWIVEGGIIIVAVAFYWKQKTQS